MPRSLRTRTRVWLRRLAWALLIAGSIIAIPNTLESFDFTVKKRNPGGPSWRAFGTAAETAPSSVITEEQQRLRNQAFLIAGLGYGAIIISLIILFAVKKPPPWATKPSRRRPDGRERTSSSEQKPPGA